MIHENFTWPKYDQRYLNPVTVPNNPYRDPLEEQIDLNKKWMIQFMEEIYMLYRDCPQLFAGVKF